MSTLWMRFTPTSHVWNISSLFSEVEHLSSRGNPLQVHEPALRLCVALQHCILHSRSYLAVVEQLECNSTKSNRLRLNCS